ncbi:MAG TPA: Hsp20/alpha crystallin family protein [Burkholderiaceae bacterium]|nr:Hsp20/alpha crystallin family protein [Burkholderiaceae bacterium]HMX10017.1 Hsp20/alpha crystallin family protein [Burkholderiaceae bacterium]HNG79489.1 Hsp20/alpha crystallin family protein [Burkholderiaceae bacterium]
MNTVTAKPQAADPATARSEATLLPPVDVIEDASGITLFADLPGVAKEQLHLRVDGDQLSIEGDLLLPAPAGIEAQHAEVTLTRYRRTFTLSKELDPEKVSAELTQGVLRVRIPKAEHAQPRKVQIQVS